MKDEEPGRPAYRPDIDGLRGVAVLAVVAFHAFPEVIRGGFIGVDIFFVISGFLIATIILGALKRGTFSFTEFYVRRIRRIFPALVVILVAVAIAGWFLYDARAYQALGRHVLGGATFSSNFLLWQESGYFDVDAERKVLLHLWSLAIEEQFYLFFPFVLWAAHARRLRPLVVTGAIGAVSFALNVFTQRTHPTADFYSPLTRAWELMLGAVMASAAMDPPVWLMAWRAKAERWLERGGRAIHGWPKENVLGKIASLGGLYLLLLGLGLITESDPFPGWYALFPTLGAALLICGDPSGWINRRVLSRRMLVWFGLISYPLYLWHWPLLSFTRVVTGQALLPEYRLAMVVVAIVLAWLTYRYVEMPLRSGKGGRSAAATLLIALLSTGVIGFSAWWAKGFDSRPVAQIYERYLESANFGDGGCVLIGDPEGFCRIGDPQAKPLAFVVGDSHAGVMRPAFAAYAHETGHSFVFARISPPLLGIECDLSDTSMTPECDERNRLVFEYVKTHGIRHLIIAARWTDYEGRRINIARDVLDARGPERLGPAGKIQTGVERTLATYRRIGVDVHLIADNPWQRELPEDILRMSEGINDASINARAITAAMHAEKEGPMTVILRQTAGASSVWDFTDAYCEWGICPLVKDGKFLYVDHDHLSVDGSLLIYPMLAEALDGLK